VHTLSIAPHLANLRMARQNPRTCLLEESSFLRSSVELAIDSGSVARSDRCLLGAQPLNTILRPDTIVKFPLRAVLA
jgi:hypothetical protein